jgi:hydrogenase nickel incorporation protein HypB
MCVTCGCGEPAGAASHRHSHTHGDHDHSHGATDHGHSHGHGHADPHHGDHDHGDPHHGDHDHVHEDDQGRYPPWASDVLRLELAVLEKNDRLAERNRGFLQAQNILALNVMSAPGAGKTSLLERVVRDLRGRVPISVIEGDQETENDARRMRAAGCRAVQINTGAGCHLDAERVGEALRDLRPEPGSLLFIENVGNLVCPALFDLGEAAKVVLLSVAEGEDKPGKYPHMFRAADAMVLTKIDLLPHLDFDVGACLAGARRVNPALRTFPLSARQGDGLAELYGWFEELARAKDEAR